MKIQHFANSFHQVWSYFKWLFCLLLCSNLRFRWTHTAVALFYFFASKNRWRIRLLKLLPTRVKYHHGKFDETKRPLVPMMLMTFTNIELGEWEQRLNLFSFKCCCFRSCVCLTNDYESEASENKTHSPAWIWKARKIKIKKQINNSLSCGERWRRKKIWTKKEMWKETCVELIVGVANCLSAVLLFVFYCVFPIWAMYFTLIFPITQFVLAHIFHFQGWLGTIWMNVADKRCMDAIKIYSECGWFPFIMNVKSLTQLSFEWLNWMQFLRTFFPICYYCRFCAYLLVFLVQNRGFCLCNERIDRFHQSKCTWLEFYFPAIPMLNNGPKPFCWSKHLAMIRVFLTSGNRNERKR